MAGRLGSNTRQLGEILINGHKQKLAFGTSVRGKKKKKKSPYQIKENIYIFLIKKLGFDLGPL